MGNVPAPGVHRRFFFLDDGHGNNDPLHLIVEIKGYRAISTAMNASLISAILPRGGGERFRSNVNNPSGAASMR